MKHLIFLVAIIILVAMTGCQKMNPVEPPDSQTPYGPTSGAQIVARLSGGDAIEVINNSIRVELGPQVNFSAIARRPGLRQFRWYFDDNGTWQLGQNVFHAFYTLGTTRVRLESTDSVSYVYRDTLGVNVVASLDGLPDLVWVSHSSNGNGTFNEVLALKKSVVKFASPPYNYQGMITNPPWILTNVQLSDTNWLLVNNNLVAPIQGDNGKYFVIRMTVSQGLIEFGAGKSGVWGKYNSPYCDTSGRIMATILADGTPTPIIVPTLPGMIGDEGSGAILRFLMKDSSVVVYMNNFSAFSSITPFVVTFDTNGVRSSPIHQSAVPGYVNWGSLEFRYSAIKNSMLEIKYGSGFNNPTVVNPSMPQSLYWDPYAGRLVVGFSTVGRPITKEQRLALR